jgi:hypothetical protein
MCNTYTNEHYWVIGSNTSRVSVPLAGQPCQCGAVRWKASQQTVALDKCDLCGANATVTKVNHYCSEHRAS